jgi:hypothetical protein
MEATLPSQHLLSRQHTIVQFAEMVLHGGHGQVGNLVVAEREQWFDVLTTAPSTSPTPRSRK